MILKSLKVLAVTTLSLTGLAPSVEAQNLYSSSREDVELYVAAIQTNTKMPSRAALEEFGLNGSDRSAFANIIQRGVIDLSVESHQRVYLLAVLPAAKFIHATETRTAEEARRMGANLSEIRQKRAFAYEIMEAVGTEYDETALSGLVSVGEARAFEKVDGIVNDSLARDPGALQGQLDAAFVPFSKALIGGGACVARISLDRGFDIAATAGDSFVSESLFLDAQSSFSGRFQSASAYLAVAGNCRPDANDKICNQSDDALTSDTCATSTNKYCRLVAVTGGGGVKKCTQASDGAD